MTFGVFLAVLTAAFLHASWNALIKFGGSKYTGLLIMAIVQGMIGFGVALTRPFPGGDVWPWLLASGLAHVVCLYLLSHAYEQGDLSRVYPISRGRRRSSCCWSAGWCSLTT